MPARFELNIDHQVIEMEAWDVVTQGDLERYWEEVATLPDDLGKTIEYLDFSKASDLALCPLGALQLARFYEGLVDRGLRGCVICAPDRESFEKAGMLIDTLTDICGDLPEGYRLTKAPLPAAEVRSFLHGSDEPARLVA